MTFVFLILDFNTFYFLWRTSLKTTCLRDRCFLFKDCFIIIIIIINIIIIIMIMIKMMMMIIIYFFDRDRAVSWESCNLIGSGSGQYFPIS